jgi:hypothetical protein
LGILKSYFGSSYGLNSIDFAVSERNLASLELGKIWLRSGEKVEILNNFKLGDIRKNMPILAQVIFNQMSDARTWPEYATARDIEKIYIDIFNSCKKLDSFLFSQGCLLYLGIIRSMQQTDSSIEIPSDSTFEEKEIAKMVDFLFAEYQSTRSIYSSQFQTEFRKNFSL